jgi:hypothetical protein
MSLAKCRGRWLLLIVPLLLGNPGEVPAQVVGPVAQRQARSRVATDTTLLTGNFAVVFHMTGLVMIVPSPSSVATTVYLPSRTGHGVWLGFGIDPSNNTAPCDINSQYGLQAAAFAQQAKANGICYVDLDRWSLEQFGTGGVPRPAGVQLSSEIVNVTELTGGVYKAPSSLTADRSILFLTGWTSPTLCSLANWTFEPADAGGQVQQAQVRSMANLVDWEITNPAGPLQLVFVPRSGPAVPVPVPLPTPVGGKIELILANVPVGDLLSLPPAQAVLSTTIPTTADHFHEYYRLLHKANGDPVPGTLHRIPHDPVPITARACEIAITLAPTVRILSGVDEVGSSIGTYACMPASGTPP